MRSRSAQREDPARGLTASLSQPALASGAWSTELRARGVPGPVAEAANLTHPDVVMQLAREYVKAGARFLTTNTFALNESALQHRGVSLDWRQATIAGVRLAREAADQAQGASRPFVVGVTGPSGALLSVGELSPPDLERVFTDHCTVMAEAGAELICLETFSDLEEARIAVRAARTTDLPVIASLSLDSGPQRTRTHMGAEAGDAARALEQAGASAIGSNCGAGVAHALPAVVALRSATRLPLWIKPSVGLPELENGQPVYRQPPDEFAAAFETLLDAGANVVGGCCGAGPLHIEKLGQKISRLARPAGSAGRAR